MQKKVYVVNAGGHNYADAERFGTVVFCTEGPQDKLDVNQMYRNCADTMQDASPDDHILITSLASLCSVACAFFAARFGQLHLLLYKDGQYISRSLYFDGKRSDNLEKDSQLDFPQTSQR